MSVELSPRRAQTRAQILDAAIAEFLERGYGGATLATVAAGAAVSTATLHKYFPTKQALFGGVMARFWQNEDADPPALPTGDARAALLIVGRAYAQLILPDQTAALFRVVIAETIRHPELGQELYARGKKPYLDRLEIYLRGEAALGHLVILNVALAVRQFLGMINDVLFWPRLLVSDLRVSEPEAETVIEAAVSTFLARYAAPSPTSSCAFGVR